MKTNLDTHHLPRRLVTAAEVAEFLSFHQDTVRRWTRDGRIPAIRLGVWAVRYDLEQVERALVGDARGVADRETTCRP